MTSFWRRLFGHGDAPRRSEKPAPALEDSSNRASSEDDLRLIPCAPGRGADLPAQHRLQELLDPLNASAPATVPGADEIIALIDELSEKGSEGQALALLERFTKLLPDVPGLRLHLAEMHMDRRDIDQALALLQPLTAEPSCRLRANTMLGEHHAQEGELDQALQHYEQVLALDFSYPRTRKRAEAIKRQLDDTSAPALPTLFGAEDLGPGARYALQRELGRGGWGTVYLAHDRQLNRPVALKILHPHVRQRPAACLHLFCEARIAASLRHPGIIAIYDLDEALALIVMEHCSGGTLADRIAEGALAPHRALHVLAALASILDIVHRCGVVHRDIKPANLLSRGQGANSAWRAPHSAALALSDFGIAHMEGETPEGPGGSGSLIYMAPEQRRGSGDDPRADLFSTGILLLEMLLGRPPQSPAQARQEIPLREMAPLWDEMGDLFPRALREPFLKMARSLVATAPADRPADALTLSREAAAIAAAATAYHRDLDLLRAGELQRNSPAKELLLRWLDTLSGPGSH